MADLPEPMTLTATADNADEVRASLASLPGLPEGYVWGLSVVASGEVTRPPYADECVAAHPNQPCPGYPHEGEPQ